MPNIVAYRKLMYKPAKVLVVYVLSLLASSPAAGYGLRKLSSAYAGSAIRVRRSSDNTELGIGFIASGGLDVATLLTFVGSGNGYVSKWYDQSGNGRDVSQSTLTVQPIIVSAGSLVTSNSLPALSFVASNGYNNGYNLSATTWGSTGNITHNLVITNDPAMPSGGGSHAINNYNLSPNVAVYFDTPTSIRQYPTGVSFGLASTERAVITTVFTSSSGQMFKNGTGSAIGAGSGARAGISIGSSAATGQNAITGKIQEVITFDSVPSTADRQLLERNQGSYFGITVA